MIPAVRQTSAGGVVVRRQQVLLIRIRTRGGRAVWTFPKGRIEAGELPVTAALREVREETGYHCRVVAPLHPPTRYRFIVQGQRILKTVHWFLMVPTRKAGRYNPREVEEARWVPLPEAYDKLFYRSDRALLAAAEDVHAQQVG